VGGTDTPTASAELDVLVAELVERCAAADRRGAVGRTRALHHAGVPDATLRAAVARAQTHVGELWQAGQWTVAQEHAATAVAEAVVATLDDLDAGRSAPTPVQGRVALVAADGEWHALPALLVAQGLTAAGVEVHYLGASVPADDVGRTLPLIGVDAVAVSVTIASNLVGAARTVAAARAADLPVVVGGRASSPERARTLGADAHAPDVDTGVEVVRRWLGGGERPATPEPTLAEDPAAALRRRRPAVVDAAYDATVTRWPELETASEVVIDRVVTDLQQLADHLEAAVLLDDAEVVASVVPWLGEVHAGRALPPDLTDHELDALLEVLGGDHPEARVLLAHLRPGSAG
jgi:methanogenic corrinoid protein MtbC1